MAHRMVSLAWLAGALLWLAAPQPALAQDGGEPERPLYGLAMAGAYLAAPLLGGLTTVTAGPELGAVFFLGIPPAVHLAYDDLGWAMASLFAPTVLSLGGAWAAIVLSDCGDIVFGNCGLEAATGALLGYLAWSILDVTVSSLRSDGLHQKSKTSPRLLHRPPTPEARPVHSFGPWLDRSVGWPRG